MRGALWYLLHLQLPFLHIIMSVPQLLAQGDASGVSSFKWYWVSVLKQPNHSLAVLDDKFSILAWTGLAYVITCSTLKHFGTARRSILR